MDVQAQAYRWFEVSTLNLVTLDVYSTVLPRHDDQQGAMVDVEVWRCYRGRADYENRIKELKSDFSLDSFALNDFWATEAALGFAMPAYNLMSLFRQAVLRTKVKHTLSTLHGQVLAICASWHRDAERNTLILSLPRRRRVWFEGLWSNVGHPPVIPVGSAG